MKTIILVLSLGLLGFACEDQAASLEDKNDLVRMVIQETQCANPWEMSQDRGEYRNNIKDYLQTKGVEAKSVEVLDELPPDTALCMACTCWSGNNIYVSVPASQVDEAEALGFSKAE